MTIGNVYKKLADAKFKISQTKLKPTGENKHMVYMYLELKDFIPQTNEIFNTLGLIGIFSFEDKNKEALLIIKDVEDGSEIVFKSPIVDGGLRGATAIQGLGACQTYIRRYLWIQALDLVENDQINNQKKEALVEAQYMPQQMTQAEEATIIEYSEQALNMAVGTTGQTPEEQREFLKEISQIKPDYVMKSIKQSVNAIFKKNNWVFDNTEKLFKKNTGTPNRTKSLLVDDVTSQKHEELLDELAQIVGNEND